MRIWMTLWLSSLATPAWAQDCDRSWLEGSPRDEAGCCPVPDPMEALSQAAKADPAFTQWMQEVHDLLLARFHPPRSSARRKYRDTLRCRVHVQLDPTTGQILGWELFTPSGSAPFDAAALDAVAAAGTLPLPPEKYRVLLDNGLGIDFEPLR